MTSPPRPTRSVGEPPQLAPEASELSVAEQSYVKASRAENTLRGYRSDWAEWCDWALRHGYTALPAEPSGISRYLTALAVAGAKVGTINRRLAAIRFAHRLRTLPDPTADAVVTAVWEGIQRTHGRPPDQSLPIRPPLLNFVVDACPTVRDDGSPSLAGLRDRALILVGFVGALRRSELCAVNVEDFADHPSGLTLSIPHSKTDQYSVGRLAVLPTAGRPSYCPVAAVHAWLSASGIVTGPLFRRVRKSNSLDVKTTALNAGSANRLVKNALLRAGIDPTPYSAHGLRAGFITHAHELGASDRAIAHQTGHSSLASLTGYVRVETAWHDNAATDLAL